MLSFFGEHTGGTLVGTWSSFLFDKVQRLKSIETISKVLSHLLWVVTIRENIKKSLVGYEVESREGLLLLFEVVIKRALTHINPIEQLLEQLLSSLGETRFHNRGRF